MNSTPFYLIFGATLIEIAKIIRPKLKKSAVVAAVQLFVLILSILATVKYSVSILFVLASILMVTVIVTEVGEIYIVRNLTLTQKFVMVFCIISVGVALIVYGTVVK
ncbi:hypothetical protein [Archaeoglobus neptunius]|uniref:hypothetical protein n=1 Tax=Archaeoglobus neptunius TaxID=2798580 RepID=UPI001927391F|nr:hypothetical protein [Archaeoglobus neptunius]